MKQSVLSTAVSTLKTTLQLGSSTTLPWPAVPWSAMSVVSLANLYSASNRRTTLPAASNECALLDKLYTEVEHASTLTTTSQLSNSTALPWPAASNACALFSRLCSEAEHSFHCYVQTEHSTTASHRLDLLSAISVVSLAKLYSACACCAVLQ